jgi:murein DD-endopeptidase
MTLDGFRLFLIITSVSITQAFGQSYQRSLEMRIPHKPEFVIIEGKPTAYYELFLTNFSSDSVELRTLSVLNTSGSTEYILFSKDDLKKKCTPIGISQTGYETIIRPGGSNVVYIELILQGVKRNASAVHRLEFAFKSNAKNLHSEIGAVMDFAKDSKLVLGAPLKDGTWAAVYEPSWKLGHRRVIYTVNGEARIPGRYAIDFIRLDSQGKFANGNDDEVKNWFGYANDVLAVADGVVASTINDFPESPTLSAHPKYTADKATGNYISIDIGNNRFAFYEHLKPGSVKVKPGQQVKKGDVIASLGFTGQTTGPHLHFHIANANSPLGAEGISFVFERFTVLGSYPDFEKFGKVLWAPIKNSNQSAINEERPSPNSVIKF